MIKQKPLKTRSSSRVTMRVKVPGPDDLLDLQLFTLESLRAKHGQGAVRRLRRLCICKVFHGINPSAVGLRQIKGPIVQPGAEIKLPGDGIIIALDTLSCQYDWRAFQDVRISRFQMKLTAWAIERRMLLPVFGAKGIEEMAEWLQSRS